MRGFPRTWQDGLHRWRAVTHTASHFRAVQGWAWRQASSEARTGFGLAVVAGLVALAVALAAAGSLGEMARRALIAGGGVAGREAAVQAGALLLAGAVLYGLGRGWPRVRVLEARPGWLRFGPWAWPADAVAHLELRTRIVTHTTDPVTNPYLGTTFTRSRGVEVWVHPRRGRPRRVWTVWGRGAPAARTWAQHMARLAGVPVRPARAHPAPSRRKSP